MLFAALFSTLPTLSSDGPVLFKAAESPHSALAQVMLSTLSMLQMQPPASTEMARLLKTVPSGRWK